MPCPCFEPRHLALAPEHAGARLPLLEEYDGLCHAAAEAHAVPSELRFKCCNHGYSRGCCAHFPSAEARSSLRYTVLRQTPARLEILCIEEQQYAPLRWQPVEFILEGERIEPEIADVCMRAQIVSFCRSYLKRFSN